MYKSEYDQFVSNPIWKEIVSTLEETKVGLYSDIAHLDPIAEATELARKQGRLYMLEFVQTELLADILREIIEDSNKVVEEKEDE